MDRTITGTPQQRKGSAARALALAVTLLLTVGSPAIAGDWSVRLESASTDVFGHDQHVLNVHTLDLDVSQPTARTSAVTLDTDTNFSYLGELRYSRGKWGLGVDFFWHTSGQKVTSLATAADGAAADRVRFEIAGGSFVSDGPGEVLFFDRLEDTDIALWTADLYAFRALTDRPRSTLALRFGLRNADFDNDYHAAIGLEGVGGTRVDASSNYGRMLGPLIGLELQVRRGKNVFDVVFVQSVVFGDPTLTSRQRDFTGPFSVEPDPPFGADRLFRATQDVAIPISEGRLRWTYRATRHLGFGAGVRSAVWLDVPVPPGVRPAVDGAETLHENTLVLFSLTAGVEVTF